MSGSTLLIIAVAAAAAALVSAAAALLLARSARSRGPVRPSLEALQAELERLRAAAEFAGIVDPPDLCARILQVAVAATGAEAGAIALLGSIGNPPVVACMHLSDDELGWLAPSLYAVNDAPIIARYLYDDRTVTPNSRYSTVTFVPLRDTRGTPVGTLATLWRFDLHEEADAHVRTVEQVADDATAAVTSARRFSEAVGSPTALELAQDELAPPKVKFTLWSGDAA